MTAISLTTCLGMLCVLSAQCAKPEIPEDARWDYRFGLPGVQGNVMAMAFDKKSIYVGGFMQSIGRTVVDGVAEIDGKRVSALPDGPQQHPSLVNVTDLEMFQGKLCVAGYFTNIANQPAGGFGVWNGIGWDQVEITNGFVFSLEADGNGGLLAAGRFFLPGGTNPVALARWDGKGGWEHFNSELPPCDDEVCIEAAFQPQALSDGNVILTLQLTFNTWPPRSIPEYILARCDADSNWHNMPGPNGDPTGMGYYDLATYRGQVVAGGAFTNAANPSLRNIALWDGIAWQPIGGGLEHQVFAVAGNDRVLYAAIYFTGANNLPQVRIMQWDGKTWSRVGSEDFYADPTGRLYLSPRAELFYSGFFTGIGSVVAPNLIRWDGKGWEPVLKGGFQGISGRVPFVLSIAEHEGKVCIGGRMTTAGGLLSHGVAAWDGQRWQSIGGGILGSPAHSVRAMSSAKWGLVVGGVFTNMGGISCSNIAQWNGDAWNPLGAGINGTVAALTVHNGSLVAGGRFTQAGGVAANNIASWNGAEWQTLGAGCSSNVSALISWRGDLFAGGRFLTAGGVAAPRMARWNGSVWQGMGGISGGSTATVNDLAAAPDALYVGGAFTNAGGKPIRSLARWDGTNWSAVGGGWPGTVNALGLRGNSLYVGGNWTNASGKTVDAVKCWDGTNWISLGSGITDPRGFQRVSALLPTRDALWVGGRFPWAGGKPSANIARWIESPQLGMIRRFDKHGKNKDPDKLEFHIDSGMRGHLEVSRDLMRWTTLPNSSEDCSDWQIDAPDTSGQWFYRVVIER